MRESWIQTRRGKGNPPAKVLDRKPSHSAARLLWATLLLSILFALPDREAIAQLKIMPLGDSITEGDKSTDGGGYRTRLYDLLNGAGNGNVYPFDFIGSQRGGGLPDKQHEGHLGFNADQIRDNVDTYLSDNPPQVVLLLVGTNDISHDQDAAGVRNEIAAIVDKIQAFNPETEIYLSTLTPRKDFKQTIVEVLNPMIKQIATEKSTPQSPVYLVDSESRFKADPAWQSNLMFDEVHPSDAGYVVLARAWFDALVQHHQPSVRDFTDNFDGRSSLGGDWNAHSAMTVVDNQLVNTSPVDSWDKFLAIPKVIRNPQLVQFAYGSRSTEIARAFTGLAVMLNDSDPDKADGYMIFHNFGGSKNDLRLHELVDGIPNPVAIQKITAGAAAPQAGDVFRVEISTDKDGHRFNVFLNDQFDGELRDPNRLHGNGTELYAGVQINGATTNGVDNFYATTAGDLVAPGQIRNLSVISATSSSVILAFTAPGDDGDNVGRASLYDVRYSTEAITANNFNLAHRALNIPSPKPAGESETIRVTGLDGGTTYFFAIKAVDEAGNFSPISNRVSATTAALSTRIDRFNRTGPGLGDDWAAGEGMHIVNGTVQNQGPGTQLAILKTRRKPQELSLTWGDAVTNSGIRWSGIALRLNDTDPANADGYFIRHDNSAGANGKTSLWHLVNGQPAEKIDGGSAFEKINVAGSIMFVELDATEGYNAFRVYFNGILVRILADTAKLENGPFAGFVLESGGDINAVEAFSIGVPILPASKLTALSGDGQIGSVNTQLNKPLVVKLEDSNFNPVPGKALTFEVTQGDALIVPPPSPDGNIRIEAETGDYEAPLEVRQDDNAARGKFLTYPSGQTAEAKVTYNFTIETAGTYLIWTRNLKAPAGSYGSWRIVIDKAYGDSDLDFVYDVFQKQYSETWAWDLVSKRKPDRTIMDPYPINLSKGQHTIEFHARIDETWLDKFILTSDTKFVPNGLEDPGFVTSNEGIARGFVALGSQAGPVTVEARHGALSTTFSLIATGGAATKMVQTSGNNQAGQAGKPLPQPLVVTIQDSSGNAVAGHRVSWVITQGDGRLSTFTSVSDLSGQASTILTLGTSQAANQVVARSNRLNGGGLEGSGILFNATATSGLATRTAPVSGTGQSAPVRTELANPVVMKVVDASNRGVPNFPVDWVVARGGGSLAGGSKVQNGGFEATTTSGAPANWGLEGSPSASEVQVSSNSPRSGNRSLRVNSSREGVGVRQGYKLAANTNYTLTFWAKVLSGSAVVNWRLYDQAGEPVQYSFNILPVATGNAWVKFAISRANSQAGLRPVLFKTGPEGGQFYIDDVEIVNSTDSNGKLSTTWTLGDTAGIQEIQARALVGSTNLPGSPVSFTAVGTPGPAAGFEIASGNNQVGSTSQPLRSPLVVRVVDNTGINGVPGVEVKFEVISGGGDLDGGKQSVFKDTGADGTAAVTLTLGPELNVPNEVTASVATLGGASVVFSAIAAVPTSFQRVAGSQRGSAGYQIATPLTIRIAATNNKPISGYPVLFEVTEGGGSINQKSTETILTNENGYAEAPFVCGPEPGGSNKIRASAEVDGQPINGSPKIFEVVSFPLDEIKVESGNNQQGIVGKFLRDSVKVSIRDQAKRRIPGQPVTFKVIKGGGKLEGGVTEKVVLTDRAGIARIRWRLGTRPVINRVTAQADSTLRVSTLTFKATATVGPPAELVKAAGDSSKGVIGNQLANPFVAQVTDEFGNPIDSVEVKFQVVAGGGSINGKQQVTVPTNAEGKAQITLTLGTTAGRYNNVVEARAFNGSIPLNNSPARFYATATASKARSMIHVAGRGQVDRAGEPLPEAFRVKVRDAKGNGVPGHPVRFRVIRGGGSFRPGGATDTTVATNENGIAKLFFTMGGTMLPDSQVVEATSNDGSDPLANSPMRFVVYARAGFPSEKTSFVSASGTAPANGQTPMPVTVYVRDRFGNPVKGESVFLEVQGGRNEVSQPTEKTDAEGKTTGSFTSTSSGLKVITARIPSGITITNAATVQFTPLAANQMSLRGGNNQTGNFKTAVAEPLTVKVGDKFNNGVPNHEVTFTVKSGPGRMYLGGQSITVRTDANGIAEAFFIYGETTGTSQIWAESAGLRNSPVIFIATAVNQPARNLGYVSGNNQEGIAGEELADSLVVKVTSKSGKPVYDIPVNFFITYGGGRLNPSSVSTNVFGEARVALRLGDQAGLNTVRAKNKDLKGSPIDFSAHAIGGRPCCIRPSRPGAFTGTVNGMSEPVSVKVTDRHGNGIDGYTVEFLLLKGTGTLTATRAATQNGGVASTRIAFDTISGYRTVRAIAPGLDGSPLYLQVFAKPEKPVAMRAVARTNNQNGTIGKQLNFPLQVKFLDRFDNPVYNELADFVVRAGGGLLSDGRTSAASIRTRSDSSGVASAFWTIGSSPGTNKASAIRQGFDVVDFTATGFLNNFPIFADVPDQSLLEKDQVEFTLTATDADGDPITYGAGNLPAGSAFDSLNTRIFTWQPNFNQAGIYEPEFYARDGKGGVDIEVVRIEVRNRNRPPDIDGSVPEEKSSLPDTTLPLDSSGVARFTMWIFASDKDGDALHYSWEQNGVPVGGDSPSYDFVGTAGVNWVKVRVSDGMDTVTMVWAIKVPVLLSNFSASATSNGRVKIQWSTSAESNNAGFNLLRSRSRNGTYTKINDEIIRPNHEGTYSFVDTRVEAGGRYFYKLEDIDLNGNITLHGPIEIEVTVPKSFELSQNYPNPFNPTTNIQFQLPKPAYVKLTIYNLLGQVVRRLVNEKREAGVHTVIWNGRDRYGNLVPSGIYHYRLEADHFVATKKMVVAK